MLICKSKNASKILGFILTLSIMLSAAVLVPGPVVQADTQATYYVDPVNGLDTNNGTSTAMAFKTIGKARDVVCTINTNMTGDIYVYLRGGTYTLTSALSFTNADSGTNGYNYMQCEWRHNSDSRGARRHRQEHETV